MESNVTLQSGINTGARASGVGPAVVLVGGGPANEEGFLGEVALGRFRRTSMSCRTTD